MGDALLFTVNLIPTHGTLVLTLTFKIFPFMRLIFLHTTAALTEMDVAVAGNFPWAEIVFMFLRCQLPKANQCLTDLCLRATEVGIETEAEGIYAFLKLEVRQLHGDRNFVTHGGIGLANNPRVVYSLAVLEDIQPVAEVDLAGGAAVIHFLQLLVAAGGDIDILCQGAVAAKRHITGNGGVTFGEKRRAIAHGQLHVLQRVLGQRCDRDGLIVAVYQTRKV